MLLTKWLWPKDIRTLTSAVCTITEKNLNIAHNIDRTILWLIAQCVLFEAGLFFLYEANFSRAFWMVFLPIGYFCCGVAIMHKVRILNNGKLEAARIKRLEVIERPWSLLSYISTWLGWNVEYWYKIDDYPYTGNFWVQNPKKKGLKTGKTIPVFVDKSNPTISTTAFPEEVIKYRFHKS